MLRHRDAWAVEAKAPSRAAWEKQLAEEAADLPPDKPPAPKVAVPTAPASPAVVRRVVEASPSAGASPGASSTPLIAPNDVILKDVAEREVLIVVSKMKKYIKDRSGFNCSDAVADVLSEHVRAICDEAIRSAGRDERKTVLDRDIPRPRR